jgi:hypothetical protein
VAHIPIHNETAYPLTEAMMQDILRDALEYFGEEVHAIRVQSGLKRHVFNARTHEVRYALSPQDFGLVHTLPIAPEPLSPEPPRARRPSHREAEPEADLRPAAWEDVEVDAEHPEPRDTSLESLDEGQDDDEEDQDDAFTLDDQNDDEKDEEEDDEEDQEDDEDESFLDNDAYDG